MKNVSSTNLRSFYFFDTHAHLLDEDDGLSVDAYMARAETENVREILLCTTHPEQIGRYLSFIEQNAHLYFTVGIHPLDLKDGESYPDGLFLPYARHPQMLAVGEVGLDYFYEGETRIRQIEAFESMLNLALKMDKPVVVHTRDKMDCDRAYADAYALLKPFHDRGGRFELHSYAGDAAWLRKFIDLDGYFGVNGMVTFRKSDNIRDVVRLMPRDRIMLETDSPYLTPMPYRGQENHPAFTAITGKFTAELLQIPVSEFAALTTENAHRFFRLKETE